VENPEVDELDLKLINALRVDGRAPASRIGTVLGVSDQTVARRLRKLRTTVNLRVLGAVNESRLGRNSWVIRVRCGPDVADQLAAALSRRADTSYVALFTGGTEVAFLAKPRTRQERDELLDRLQRTPRVLSVTTFCVLHYYLGGSGDSIAKIAPLTPQQESALRPPPVRPLSEPTTLDSADEALLAVLCRDGRATHAELQGASGLSEDQVRRRLERLRRTGVLYFDVQYDLESIGHTVAALLWLTVAPAKLAEIGHTLAHHKQTTCVMAITGRANIFVAAHFRSMAEFHEYLSDRIGALDGVREAETDIELRRLKHFTYEPPAKTGPSGRVAGFATLPSSPTDDHDQRRRATGARVPL
jgi:DNA-binding Lrp family transcriptional regulator